MDQIRVMHDVEGQILTIWLKDPQRAVETEETASGLLVMLGPDREVLGVQVLGFTGPLALAEVSARGAAAGSAA